MTKQITYKLQGDGRDSWIISEFENNVLINKYMVYELPNEYANTLKQAKDRKFNEIDSRTQELIALGFSFSGLYWSLSVNAQINWSNLPNIPQEFFPIQLLDVNTQSYELSYNDRINFYLKAVTTKNTLLQAGGLLKQQVNNLITIEEVLNFKDPR